MIDEDLMKVTPHLKYVLLWWIINICYLKDLAILLGIEERNLKVEIGFIQYYFNNMNQLNMPNVWDKFDVQASINEWLGNSHGFFANQASLDVSQ